MMVAPSTISYLNQNNKMPSRNKYQNHLTAANKNYSGLGAKVGGHGQLRAINLAPIGAAGQHMIANQEQNALKLGHNKRNSVVLESLPNQALASNKKNPNLSDRGHHHLGSEKRASAGSSQVRVEY